MRLAEIRRALGEGLTVDLLDCAQVLEELRGLVGVAPCFEHPLGFHHIELTAHVGQTSKVGQRFRAHLWSESSARFADELGLIHDHMWPMASLVVHGALRNELLQPQFDENGDLALVDVRYNGDLVSRSRGDRRVTMDCSHQEEVEAGEVYSIPAQVMHRTVVLRRPLLTLVVTGTPSADQAVIASPHDAPIVAAQVRRSPASRKELLLALEELSGFA